MRKNIPLLVALSMIMQGAAVYAEPVTAAESNIETVNQTEYDETYTKEIDSCSVRGILSTGNTLHFGYESADGVAEADISCEWFKADSPDGTYTSVGTGPTYKTTAKTAPEYYYAEATLPNGAVYTTDKVTITGYNASNAYWPAEMSDVESSWERVNNAETVLEYTATGLKTNSKKYLYQVPAYSNPEYMFAVNGQKFILVDTVETSDTARYKIIADASYGKEVINEAGLLNVKNKLPEAISSHIDDTVWYEGSVNTFATYSGHGISGVYPLSPKDLKENKDKVGLISCNYQTNEPAEYILNGNSKARNGGSWAYVIKSYDEEKDILTLRINGRNWSDDASKTNFGEVRPVFYIDKDFFALERLDTDSIGSKVLEMIKNTYSKEELAEVYPETVLESAFGYKAEFEINSVNAENSGDNCLVSVSVTDHDAQNDAYLIVTMYGSDEKMLSCVFVEVSATLNAAKTFTATLNKNVSSGDFIRCMMIDKSGSMDVFGKEYILEIE